jgi:hypothetical protein
MKDFLNSKSAKFGAVVVALATAFGGFVGVAGATQPTVEETMATTQTSVLTEFGYGAGLLIAVMLFVIGIRIVWKWSNKASKQQV